MFRTGVMLFMFFAAPALLAAPRPTMSFQGQLSSPAGQALPDGNYPVRFALYNMPSGVYDVTGEPHAFAGNTITLANVPVLPNSETVMRADGIVTYTRGAAYTIDYATGVITRASATAIPNGTEVKVTYQYTPRLLWQEAQTVTVATGLFSVVLGSVTPFPLTIGESLSFDEPRYLGVAVGDDPEMTPRILLQSVPVAHSLVNLRVQENDLSPNMIGGHTANATVGTAGGNVIAGGGEVNAPNTTSGFYTTVSGGIGNSTASYASTVIGGDGNSASAQSAIAGGFNSNAAGTGALALGVSNEAQGFASVALGYTSKAHGQSSVAIGYRTTAGSESATSNYSVALGHRATAGHSGSFVWGDASTTSTVESSASNQVTFRAAGGMRVFTNNGLTTGVVVLPGGGSWASASDRRLKDNIAAVDGREVLEQVAGLPVSTWNYKSQDPGTRHIGPMSQDFARAFGVGESVSHITAVDADGVALAAIQGLYEMLKEENAAKDARLERQQEQIAALQSRLEALEAQAP